MKVAGAIVIALIAVGALAAVYFAGLAVGLHRNYTSRLQELGLNRRSAVLHVRAVKILYRLAQLTDLDGILAGDQLSPETKQQVNDWVTDHRIGVNKV